MIERDERDERDEAEEIVCWVDELRGTKRPEKRVELNLLVELDIKLRDRNSALSIECRRQLANFQKSPKNSLFVAHVPLGSDVFLLISFLKVPKAPDSHLEAMIYKKVSSDGVLREPLPSAAYPIEDELCTRGLQSPQMLGFFDENIGYGGKHTDAPAVYFINRFGRRFEKFTKSALSNGTCSNSFMLLKRVPAPPIAVWAYVWLSCHEYMHNNKTQMPYQEHKRAKGSLSGGGFEEARVDLKSILHLHDQQDPLNYETIIEYILAERLLAYPLVDLYGNAQEPSFDTVGTVYVLVKMISLGFISIVEGKMSLADNWIVGIRQLTNHMADVEEWLMQQSAEVRRVCLERHVLDVVNATSIELERNPMKNRFPLPAFYSQLQNQMGIKLRVDDPN
jgi:hypothetical protein